MGGQTNELTSARLDSPTRVLVSTSASRPETFKLLKASIVRGLFKRLQCLNAQVFMEAGRQFLADSRNGLKQPFWFERPTNSFQLRPMSRRGHLRQSGRKSLGQFRVTQ